MSAPLAGERPPEQARRVAAVVVAVAGLATLLGIAVTLEPAPGAVDRAPRPLVDAPASDVPVPPSDGADPTTTPDGGATDGGVPESGVSESGTSEGGAPDSGAPGSGAPGSGVPGSGATDSGAPGSGAADGGPPDSGASEGRPQDRTPTEDPASDRGAAPAAPPDGAGTEDGSAAAGTDPARPTVVDPSGDEGQVLATIPFGLRRVSGLPDGRAALAALMEAVAGLAPGTVVRLVGHADPSGTDEVNRAYGLARAEWVRQHLLQVRDDLRYELVTRGSDSPPSATGVPLRRVDVRLPLR